MFGNGVHVSDPPDADVRFFYGLLLALALSAFVWLGLSMAVYVLVVR